MKKPQPLYLSLGEVFLKDFNLSLFIGLSLLALYHHLPESVSAYDFTGWYTWGIVPAFNGFFTGILVLILNQFFSRRNFATLYYTSDKFKLLVIAFAGGACAYYLSTSAAATYLVTIAVIIAAAHKIRHFIFKLSSLLFPRRLATFRDLGQFLNFFITLIISFAVINLSANAVSLNLHETAAFNFGDGITGIVDALYFSIITMTTVGYGDIVPITALGKIITAFECITCYLTLGIMIGIICRGITFQHK